MLKYIGKRVLQMIALFYVFIFVLFSIMSAQPGGIQNQFVGNPNIPPEAQADPHRPARPRSAVARPARSHLPQLHPVPPQLDS